MRKYDKQFIHVSTDEIYGDADTGNLLLMKILR